MRDFLARRPSPAMAVAFVALLAALSGTAIALPGTNRVDSGDIKNNSVRSKDIRNNNVTSRDIRNGSLTGTDTRNDSLTGADLNESTLGQVPSANTANSAATANRANSAGSVDALKTIGSYKLVTSSASNADLATARAAATEVPLLSFGAFTVYGKCFTDTDNTATDQGTWAEAYIRTTQNGSVLDSNNDDLDGDPAYLDTGTLEDDRELEDEDTSGQGPATDGLNTADTEAEDDGVFAAAAPDGTGITGQINLGVKNGNPTAGNGVYGPGNACLFWGHAIG